ncbi:hypothetical protein CBR_g38361 [Chara braunii]|uniref:Uncharacterized protein n=1 Tax=Chara braunii TaxID=69332 RepID=A0A388LPY1_CHABU|nr:hypothetical protein CBR_g38361 [Chara braunii]|eukprot:GBG84388.1 hypothetical protein CBR_g38361 [Chara braunii]
MNIDAVCASSPWCKVCRKFFHKDTDKDCPSKDKKRPSKGKDNKEDKGKEEKEKEHEGKKGKEKEKETEKGNEKEKEKEEEKGKGGSEDEAVTVMGKGDKGKDGKEVDKGDKIQEKDKEEERRASEDKEMKDKEEKADGDRGGEKEALGKLKGHKDIKGRKKSLWREKRRMAEGKKDVPPPGGERGVEEKGQGENIQMEVEPVQIELKINPSQVQLIDNNAKVPAPEDTVVVAAAAELLAKAAEAFAAAAAAAAPNPSNRSKTRTGKLKFPNSDAPPPLDSSTPYVLGDIQKRTSGNKNQKVQHSPVLNQPPVTPPSGSVALTVDGTVQDSAICVMGENALRLSKKSEEVVDDQGSAQDMLEFMVPGLFQEGIVHFDPAEDSGIVFMLNPNKRAKSNDSIPIPTMEEQAMGDPREMPAILAVPVIKRKPSTRKAKKTLIQGPPMFTLGKGDKSASPSLEIFVPLICSDTPQGVMALTMIAQDESLSLPSITVQSALSDELLIKMASEQVLFNEGSCVLLQKPRMGRYLAVLPDNSKVLVHLAFMSLTWLSDEYEGWTKPKTQ